MAPVSVVMITRDRRDSTLRSLQHLVDLPERPPVIVVDNGSGDGTADAVGVRFPSTTLIALENNRGAAGRTVGVQHAETPYVAFADDDSWWEPGSLARAAEIFDAHPRLALLAARILIEPTGDEDPVCQQMREAPIGTEPDLPGPSVLGFLACGAVVRRNAFLAAGGFPERYGIGGEEALLAMDLAQAGWGLAYVDEVVAHHQPSLSRDVRRRQRRMVRNDLWSAWLRRHPSSVVRHTGSIASRALVDEVCRAALADAVRGLPWVLRERRRLPAELEARLRRLELAR